MHARNDLQQFPYKIIVFNIMSQSFALHNHVIAMDRSDVKIIEGIKPLKFCCHIKICTVTQFLTISQIIITDNMNDI